MFKRVHSLSQYLLSAAEKGVIKVDLIDNHLNLILLSTHNYAPKAQETKLLTVVFVLQY